MIRKRPPDAPRPREPDEAFEPYEEFRRIPLPVYWIAIALAIWGAGRAVLRLARSLSPRLARPRTAFQPNQESAS